MTNHKIIFGDSRKINLINDKSVHLIITSPPYWQLKDYGSEMQIGFNDSYEQYINNLNLVWNECYRILNDGCRLCINIGDQFARSVYYGRYKVIPIRDEIIKFCETIGFDFMGSIIWQKVTTCNTTGGASIMGSYPYPRNGVVKLDYEYILLFKKQGTPPKVTKEAKEKSRLSSEEWNEYFSGHWYFQGVRQDKHIAMFPEELPKRLIKMFSFEGETVFDPFLGSGTTSLSALKLNRNSIGYEVNNEFKNIILDKLNTGISLLNNAEISFLYDEKCNKLDFNYLPYIFKDPVKIDKKIDPKGMSFGSVIKIQDVKKTKKENLTVKKVLEPDKIILNNGIIVKLIGIKTIDAYRELAVNYLTEKICGKKIFLNFDNEKYSPENILQAYIYLENKTFVNLHYLRCGFVKVDEAICFSKKERFLYETKCKIREN